MVETAAVGAGPIESYVARRLLQGGDADAAVFQGLGRQRRHALDCDVGTRQLGNRIVSIADQDALVELLGATDGDHIVALGRGVCELLETRIRLVDELVEEDAAQALLGARISREQRPFHHLWQVS